MQPQPQKYDIADKIAELVTIAIPDLEEKFEAQAEALQENQCNDKEIGAWVDEYDVKYLLSALALKDEDFEPMFPDMAHIKYADRQRFSATIERHFEHCTHCSLKRGYDLEIDERIKTVCANNSAELLEVLNNDMEFQAIKEKTLTMIRSA